jgi:membrane protease YdiL (CAAX protease family)
VVLLGGVVLGLGLRREAGLIARANWRTLPLYWPMAVIVVLVWAGADSLPSVEVFTKTVIFCIAVGITEEVMFRGLVFYWFRALSVRTIIVVSAASFAFIHLAVGLTSEIHPLVILGQGFLAFSLGLIFAAARARDVSVVIPILAHTGLDVLVVSAQGGISQTLDDNSQAAAGLLFIGSIVLAWGLWLLWKAPSPERHSFVAEQARDVNPTAA